MLIYLFAPLPFSFPTKFCFHSFIHMIMKSSHILFLCVLTTFYLLHQHSSFTSTSSPLNFLPGRRHVRELTTSFSSWKNEHQEVQEMDEEMKQSTLREDSTAVENRSGSENLEDIFYHIDYHGVMTHPTPTPKHPKP